MHSLLLSLLPPDLALASAPRRLDLAGLRRILAWLPSCFDAATHGTRRTPHCPAAGTTGAPVPTRPRHARDKPATRARDTPTPAGGDGAAGPVRLIERRWLLLSLLHLGREPGAPDWAAAAVSG